MAGMTIELSEYVIDAIADAVVKKMQEPKTEKAETQGDDRWLLHFGQNMAIPSAEPKTGHWIWCVGSHKCSNCEEYTCFSHKELLRYCPNCGCRMVEPQEISDHKCHNCKHYTSGERDGSCGSYICKHYSNWESEG